MGQLARLQERYDAIAEAGARVYALSVDPPWQAKAMAEDMGLSFTILCDEEKQVVHLYDRFNPYEMGGVAEPAIFVLDAEGIVRYRVLETPYKRADVDELVSFLRDFDKKGGVEGQGIAHAGLPKNLTSTTAQIAKNMFRRGSATNWKHYLLYPAFYVRRALGELNGRQKVNVVQNIPGRPEEVFEQVSDPEKMSAWADGISLRRVVDSPKDPASPNGEGSVRAVGLGPLKFEETILLYNPPRSYEYTISRGTPLKDYLGRVDVFPKNGGSQVQWTFDFGSKIPFSARLVAGAVHVGFSTGLRKLARKMR